ncbi:MAG TPA: hypothetical protein VKV21_11960 [Solirubrobacteraceae bacterium]|nr:hypothetical protein [Solirubrobacteraceae bacterium]
MRQTATKTPGPQRQRALARANRIRFARAEMKRRVALGEVSAAEIILECPEAADTWPVGELLMSQRRWGEMRCHKFLARHQIGETKQIGSLTERQRRMLAESLNDASSARRVMELVA